MNNPKLYMMVGLPGSGKSTCAQQLAKQENAIIFSSDALRQEMFGDINCQIDNTKLFNELHKRIRECLSQGNNAIYDATNINYKKRMSFLWSLNKIPCKKIAILMATSYEECLKRNCNRERKVPEDVIKRMYMNFNIPYWYEGWDEIRVIYFDNRKNSKGLAREWIESVRNYNQENYHHKLTLGEHCWESVKYIDKNTPCYHPTSTELRYAAMLHDEGKMFTKDFHNSKGEISEIAHYFGHNNVGAYNSLFYEITCNHLYVAQLIQWHMRPYLAWEQSEKAKERDKKLLGEQLFNDICLLHTADMQAH